MRKKRKLTYEMIVDLDSRLDEIPIAELPRIYNELNGRIWPMELGEPPVDFKKWPNCPESIFILDEIKHRCGNKAIWRYKKTEIENYTPQMFEDWWDSIFIDGVKNYEFYKFLEDEVLKPKRDNAVMMSIISLLIATIALLIKFNT